MSSSTAKKLPSSVLICEQRWRVVTTDLGDDEGECKLLDRRIHISNKLSYDAQLETLLHEIQHAVWYLTGTANRHGDDIENAVIDATTPMLFATLRRNRLGLL